MFPMGPFPGMPGQPPNQHALNGGPGPHHQDNNRGQRNRRPPRMDQRPVDKSRPLSDVTLAIENIPQEALTESVVREYFQKFGGLEKVAVDVPRARALVTFSNPAQAATALGSPDAVFGNRFVRVYRARLPQAPKPPTTDEDQTMAVETPVEQQAKPAAPAAAPIVPQQRPASKPTPYSRPAPPRVNSPAVNRNRALQLEHSAKAQKDLLDKLDKTQDESERQSLMAQLRKLSKEAKALRKAAAVDSLPATAGSAPASESTPEETLAKLRAEAAALGIPSS